MLVLPCIFSSAQSLQIMDMNSNVINGQTIDIWYDVTSQAVSQDFDVKMVNTGPKKIMAKRYVVSAVNGTDNLFCWVACYSANTNVSPTALVMNQNDTHLFVSHYFNYGIPGITTVNYTLYDSANTADSAMLTVRWHITPTGISTLGLPSFHVRAFPNPANGQVKITVPELHMDAFLLVNDISGKEIKRIPVPSHAVETYLETDELRNGIYFLRISSSGELSDPEKLAVVH